MEPFQLTCAERIEDELKDREEQLRDLFTQTESEDQEEVESAWEEIHSMAYGISEFRTYRVIWSGGGPADFIDIITDQGGEIQKVEYVYQDWYDGARQEVKEGSAVWRYAEMILEGVRV